MAYCRIMECDGSVIFLSISRCIRRGCGGLQQSTPVVFCCISSVSKELPQAITVDAGYVARSPSYGTARSYYSAPTRLGDDPAEIDRVLRRPAVFALHSGIATQGIVARNLRRVELPGLRAPLCIRRLSTGLKASPTAVEMAL